MPSVPSRLTLERDARRLWHPYTQAAVVPPPIPIARGQGAWLWDEDGRRYIDAISSWWVTTHGHAQPEIAAAIARQAAELEQVIFAGFTHRPAAELAEKLAAILPAGLSRIFYSDDGSTAVEVALKMALQYWRNQGEPRRRGFIALEYAYHGDTAAAMAVGAPSPFTAAFAPLLFPVARAHAAYCHRCPVGLRRETCHIECLDRLEQLLRAEGEQTAAVILEPLLQGAGGMIVHPREFLAGVRRLCDQYGVLLIADEVLTGFGRTGTMFACQQAEVTPDILCLSKGLTGGFLPLAVTACREEIYQAFYSTDRRKTLFHGHSYTANPVGCAAALASLALFEEPETWERIRRIGRQHAARLARLTGDAKTAGKIADARQIGTVAALELRGGARGESAEDDAEIIEEGYLSSLGLKLQKFYLDHGVILRPLGPIVYVLPPYSISAADLETVWDVIAASLEVI